MKHEKQYWNPNDLVRFLKKEPIDFRKEDIIRFIKKNDIKMINFNHIGGDGRLKTLNFIIRNEKKLRALLSCVSVLTDQVFFHILTLDIVIYTLYPDLKQHLLILSRKFQHLISCVHTLTVTGTNWILLRDISLRGPIRN